MTILEILNLEQHLLELSAVSGLSAKIRWNIARNLDTVSRVVKLRNTENDRIVASLGGKKLEQGTPEWKQANSEFLAFLSHTPDDVKLLRFPCAELVRDDLQVPGKVIAGLMSLIDGEPE